MSVWYWALSALVWAIVCNWTFGVPNELVKRARKGGEDAMLFDRFARRNVAMIARAIERQGVFVSALIAFVVAVIGTVALRNGSESALGVLMILGPLVVLSALSGWRIRRLSRAKPTPPQLLKAFMSERRRSVAAAAISMFLAFGAAGARHGPGWFEAMISGL